MTSLAAAFGVANLLFKRHPAVVERHHVIQGLCQRRNQPPWRLLGVGPRSNHADHAQVYSLSRAEMPIAPAPTTSPAALSNDVGNEAAHKGPEVWPPLEPARLASDRSSHAPP